MAKRRKKRSTRRRRRLGSTIRVRKLNGLGSIRKPGSLLGAALPAVIGGGTAAITTMGVRQFEGAPSFLVQYSPWVGLGASSLVALIMSMTKMGKPAAVGTFAGGLTVALSTVLMEYMAKLQLAQGAHGLAAIVPEYAGTSGTGAIVMEPHASRGYGAGPLGSYGETVTLSGINPTVFGSPVFRP